MTDDVRAAPDDRILPFAVEALDVRGRSVRLGPAIDAILARHDYPHAVSRLLGEAAALAVLLGSSLKFEGRFQLQTKSDGLVDMMVVDFDLPDSVRAYARFDREAVLAAGDLSPAALLGKGHLGLTIDQGAHMSRYQGIVALDGLGLEEAAHRYFLQSEQIPTRVRLAVGEILPHGGGAKPAWRAGGLLVQFIPTSPDRMRLADLHPGDAPEGATILDAREDDAWVEARSLAETVEDHELLDPTLTSEELLFRLFHERGVKVFEDRHVAERCRCSRTRILGMLRSFAPEERRSMVGDDGAIGVTCEFCSTRYHVAPEEIGAGEDDGTASTP